MQYHVAVCKWMRGLAQAFTAQQGVNNYSKDVAIIDLIAKHRDDILVPLGMTTKTFLAAYKAANNLQVIPSPTINFDFQGLLDKINGMLSEENLAAAPNDDDPNAGAMVVIGANNMGEFNLDGENDNDNLEMVDAANAALQPMEGIGGRMAICGLIYNAIFKGTIEPIQKFHKQCNENDEARRIKAAFTSPRLSDAAQRVASIIANEPAAQMPVLCGLVNKTTSKSTSILERCIQSLEDQLKVAVASKKSRGAKKVKGDGKNQPKSILQNKGTPAAPKKSAPKKSAPKKSSPNQDAANKGSARAKEGKKPSRQKVSFNGKKAVWPTSLRK